MKRILCAVTSFLLVACLLVAYLPANLLRPSPRGSSIFAAAGKVLNLYNIDPFTLDPAVSSDVTSHGYVMQLFSGLVRLDDKLEPAPDIAQRWQVAEDGRTYTFYLRQDVKFHDGRPVKAEDVKYSWERACAPETQSLTAATYLGDIVGAKEVVAGKSLEISGVKVVDDYTLQVTIDAPKNYFLPKLTYPTAFVVDKANVASGQGWWHNPNGTGPFRLQQWDENSLLVLEKNPLYYGELAKVDLVNFHLFGGMPMSLYETGEIDVAGVGSYSIDRVQDRNGPFYKELSIVPELSFGYIGFDATRPPFDDVNIRRAFSLAIDKDKLVSLVFRGMMQRADGILPPGMPGYNKNLSGLEFDVARAKELIAKSRYGDASRLPPVTITVSGWGGLISSDLEAIIYEWQQNLGVKVKVRQLEPQRFFYHLKEERDEMFYLGWVADYPHPQDFLDVLFHTGADNNYGEYSNPEVDRLLDMAAREPDQASSLALYQQAEQKLIDDVSCLPLWFGKNYTLVKPYVKGYNLSPMGFVRLNSVSVEQH